MLSLSGAAARDEGRGTPIQPVRDAGLRQYRQIVRSFAEGGAGVILISSYLPEILDLSDRILVAKGGTIAAEFSRAERILHAAVH